MSAAKAVSQTRKRKKPEYKHFRLTKRIKPPVQKKLPSVVGLLRESSAHIWRHKKVFLGLIVVYLLLNLVFVKGFANTVDVPGLKDELSQTTDLTGISLSATLLGVVAGTGNSPSTEVGSLYQTILLIMFGMAFIWLFRQTSETKKDQVSIKQPLYEGMTPIVPFIIVLVVVGLQLLPMLGGVSVFSTVQANGLATTGIEQGVWALLAILLSILTFYMLSSSLIALIIVTLPDMTPMAALRSARKVVAFRRWVIMRKLLVLCLLVAFIYALLLVVVISFVPALTEWVMALLGAALFPIIIGSGYKLYRALL